MKIILIKKKLTLIYLVLLLTTVVQSQTTVDRNSLPFFFCVLEGGANDGLL